MSPPVHGDMEEFIADLKDRKTELMNKFRINLNKYLRNDGTYHMEFNISKINMPLKKHILVTGIIHGLIFKMSDCFSCVRHKSSVTKPLTEDGLFLYIVGPSPQAFLSTIQLLETYVEEIMKLHEINKSRKTRFSQPEMRPARKSWKNIFRKEFSLHEYPYEVINNLLTKGILEGDVFLKSGAIVSAKGNPYLTDRSSTAQPLHLLIEGPTQQSLDVAIIKIHDLIKEVSSCQPPVTTNSTQSEPSDSASGNNQRLQQSHLNTNPLLRPVMIKQSPSFMQHAALPKTHQSSPIMHPAAGSMMQQPPPILQSAAESMMQQSPPFLQPAAGSIMQQSPPFLQPAAGSMMQQSPPFLQPAAGSMMQQSPPFLQPVAGSHMQQPTPSVQPAAGSMSQYQPSILQPAAGSLIQQPPPTLQSVVGSMTHQPLLIPQSTTSLPVSNTQSGPQTTEPSQEHLLSDVILQLQQYIQANGPGT